MEPKISGPASVPGGREVDRLAHELRRQRAALMDVVGGLDGEAVSWSPDEGIPTIADHLARIAGHELDLVAKHILGEGAGPRPARGPAGPPTLATAVRSLVASRRTTERWLEKADDLALQAPLPAAEGDLGTPRDVLESILRHEVHHRAQLMLLVQLMDPSRVFAPVS